MLLGISPDTCTLMRPCHSGVFACSALNGFVGRLGVAQPVKRKSKSSASHAVRMVTVLA